MAGRFRRVDKTGDNRMQNYKKKDSDKSAIDKEKSNLANKAKLQAQTNAAEEELDILFGFNRHCDGPIRTGFMFNMRVSSIFDDETGTDNSSLELYFVQEDGSTFKATYLFKPYFLLVLKSKSSSNLQELETYLNRRFDLVNTFHQW